MADMIERTSMPAEIRTLASGEVRIAYQVVGDGPPDLVLLPGFYSNLEYAWQEPSFAHFLTRLASFSRLIRLDHQVATLTMRSASLSPTERLLEGIRLALDAAESRRAALFGIGEGAPLALLFATRYPERTAALVLYGVCARCLEDRQRAALPAPEHARGGDPTSIDEWDSIVGLGQLAPSVADDPVYRDWWASYLRTRARPVPNLALTRAAAAIDVRPLLPSIRAPTLVLRRSDDRVANGAESRALAMGIPGARYRVLPGVDHLPWVGDAEAILAEVETILTEEATPAPSAPPERVLTTVLVTDIVGSTEQAVRLGDRQWREVL